MNDLEKTLENIGLGSKAAKTYLSILELTEATVLELARRSKLKRTTLYYTIEELLAFGAVTKTKRGKHIYYQAEDPDRLLKLAREKMAEFEDFLPELRSRRGGAYHRPQVSYLYGVPGFKKAWERIFSSREGRYRIMTDGGSFLNFVKESYLINEIIERKKKLGIKSRQLIVDSSYARKIVAKDLAENRTSKLLPSTTKLPFTEIIGEDFVLFISPRLENLIFLVESPSLAQTQRNLFDLLWDNLPN